MNLIAPNDKIAMDVSIHMAITITVISIVSGILMNFFIPDENEDSNQIKNDKGI